MWTAMSEAFYYIACGAEKSAYTAGQIYRLC